MKFLQRRLARATARAWHVAALALVGAMALTAVVGCGMAASPQPPSLDLPQPIHDLTASRSGNRITLNWTTPDETTDKLRLQSPVLLQICREEKIGSCEKIANVSVGPGQTGEYSDNLSAPLSSGPLRPITYDIIALNKHGKSAGPSNPAISMAGAAPVRVENLSATMEARGVLLRWQKAILEPGTSIRLERTLLTPPPPSRPDISGAQEPTKQRLEVPLGPDHTDPGLALDRSIAFNRKYRYVALRLIQKKNGAQLLQAVSLASEPLIVNTRDTFPPAAPTGLAAVPVSAAINNGAPEIDLSWSANTEPDFAQYLVFRQDASAANARFVQIGPEDPKNPIVAPAFRDLHVQPGEEYIYYVVAVDGSGNRSVKSSNVAATVPTS